jgi:hypothetical protein
VEFFDKFYEDGEAVRALPSGFLKERRIWRKVC